MFAPRSARVLGAALAAALIVASGCASEPTSDAPPATIGLGSELELGADPAQIADAVDNSAANSSDVERVVMIGDSITKGAAPALEMGFADLGLDVVIEAENGKRMVVSSSQNPSGVRIAEDLQDVDDASAREVWVVALGTNDIGQYASPDELAAAVNEVLSVVPDEAALVWVDTFIRHEEEQTELVNEIVEDRLERRGNAVIAPWTAFASGDGVLSGDGVHPTSNGALVFAYVVTDTVRNFLGR